MALAPFRPVGLDRDIYLPSSLDVKNDVVSHPNVRSYQKFLAHSKTTFHDTGNDGTNVLGEMEWLRGGRKGGGAGGYNAIVDAYRIRFPVPHDEVTWHAGTTLGNRTSWGTEWAYGQDKAQGRFNKSFEAVCALHAAYCEALGWKPDVAVVLHQYWYGKNCSRQVLSNGLWDEANQMFDEFIVRARVARNGGVEPEKPVSLYKPASRIKALDDALSINLDPDQSALTVAPRSVVDPKSKTKFFWVGDRVRTTEDTPRYRYAFSKSEKVGPDIPAGTDLDVDWLFIADDKKEWYLTPWMTRIFAESTVRISDAKVDS